MNRLKSVFFILLILSIGSFAVELATPGEVSRYSHYTTNREIGQFLSRLQALQPVDLKITIIGESSERDPIYMTNFERQTGHNDSLLKLFIFATQHGDEQSGKEACLSIIRDIAIGPMNHLLDSLNIYIVPLVNPYGAHHNQRRNGQGLDLNRDHVKLEAPELLALHRIFNEIFPEVTLDVHEKGEDYYLENMGLVSNANIPDTLQRYGRERILPFIENRLQQKNITFHEYLIRQRVDRDDASGARVQRREPRNPEFLYRYSTTDINDGRNSFGIYNTLSFILEGASSGRLDELGDRTQNQYEAMVAWLQYCYQHQSEIAHLVRSERVKLVTEPSSVHLRMHYQADADHSPLHIHVLARADDSVLGTLKSDKMEGDEIRWRDIQPLDSKKRKVVKRTIKDWRPQVTATVSRMPAAAYVIPPGHEQVVRTLIDHNIPLYLLDRDQNAAIEMYRVVQFSPSEADYEAPKTIKVELLSRQSILKTGTIIVPASGRHRNLVPILLEPESGYGLIRYDRYRLAPDEGGFYDVYRLNHMNQLPLVLFQNFERP
ncbi:DUF2817 domain-containing protein [candidate division KSB1 bacterium]|nr:DUF2817 domain-containing protein [candidate division KSB1 bacterium]